MTLQQKKDSCVYTIFKTGFKFKATLFRVIVQFSGKVRQQTSLIIKEASIFLSIHVLYVLSVKMHWKSLFCE